MSTAPPPSVADPAQKGQRPVAARSLGLDLEAAIESYRRNRRLRLSAQTLDRLYVPRLAAFAGWLRDQGMPTDVSYIRREHIEAYIEHLQTAAPGRSGAGQKSATVSIMFRTLRTFWRWCVAEEDVSRSPMEDFSRCPKIYPRSAPVLPRSCPGPPDTADRGSRVSM